MPVNIYAGRTNYINGSNRSDTDGSVLPEGYLLYDYGGGDARQEIGIKPLNEIHLGVY